MQEENNNQAITNEMIWKKLEKLDDKLRVIEFLIRSKEVDETSTELWTVQNVADYFQFSQGHLYRVIFADPDFPKAIEIKAQKKQEPKPTAEQEPKPTAEQEPKPTAGQESKPTAEQETKSEQKTKPEPKPRQRWMAGEVVAFAKRRAKKKAAAKLAYREALI
ncbi:hypothetical protein JL12_01690 [Gallibacterium anatis 10672-6]|uniref:hypothetical protein n=1 Tax=Gallibacterium anatis TaxID=750 RepID=UPI000531D254|nr:hypothetical protein [Gallibacterium anatis]KGQ52202.1 hypothetical protein JL12_01690 [Gallibacterium anatis 10672-6]